MSRPLPRGGGIDDMAISLAEEQRRMKRHPGIVFRDGATGRRPALEDGPQVWVLARLFREHPLDSEVAKKRAATETATWMELPFRSVLAAVRYYVDYRDEIDDWIRDLDEHSDRAEAAWRVKQGLASQLKLLLDEMWSPAVARQLRARGHDVVAVAERHALRTKSDAVILAASLEENRIVVTEDADDYRDLALAEAREGRGYPAFIVTSNNRWPRGNPRTLGRLVRALDALLDSGRTIEGEHWLTPVD